MQRRRIGHMIEIREQRSGCQNHRIMSLFLGKAVLTIPCKHVVYAGLTMKVQGRPVPQTV